MEKVCKELEPLVEKAKEHHKKVMEQDIMKMTKKELMELENFYDGRKFNTFVIVPMNYKHDSGYQCMKYILLDNYKIIGVVGGGSDVVHFNGIGGFGKNRDFTKKTVPIHDLRIDCLPKSKCIRVFTGFNDYMELDTLLKFGDKWVIGSDFIFYFSEEEETNE